MDNTPIQEFFGISNSSYFVIPRSILQSMPTEWQLRWIELQEELENKCASANIGWPSCKSSVKVTLRDCNNLQVRDKYFTFDDGKRNVFSEK